MRDDGLILVIVRWGQFTFCLLRAEIAIEKYNCCQFYVNRDQTQLLFKREKFKRFRNNLKRRRWLIRQDLNSKPPAREGNTALRIERERERGAFSRKGDWWSYEGMKLVEL